MIIVTGASKGLGRAICERLLKKKFEVLGLSRNVKGIPFSSYSCDVSSYEQVKKIANKLKSKKKKISGLINAAGIASMNLALTTPYETVVKIIATNLLGTIFACKIFTPLMIRENKGNIINFSTIAVPLGLKGESIYVASKSGVEGFTKTFAREVADFNIKVNCIAPGPIKTDLLKGVTNRQIKKVIKKQIFNKQYTKDTICDVVEILLDKKTDSITGQIVNVGGV